MYSVINKREKECVKGLTEDRKYFYDMLLTRKDNILYKAVRFF